MIEVSSEEIISQKTLPYDIYDEAGIKILEAGEILTPGKILLVRNYEVLFRKELKEEEEQEVNEIKEKIIETPEQEQETIEDFGPINKKSKLDFQSQYELKCDYNNAMDFFNRNDVIRAKSMILETRDKIIKNSQLIRKNAKFFSELKLLGEYKNILEKKKKVYFSEPKSLEDRYDDYWRRIVNERWYAENAPDDTRSTFEIALDVANGMPW